jgi:hypothetical protein
VCAFATSALVPAGATADPAVSSGGGVMFVETPRIAKVKCVRRCASGKRVQGGSVVRIAGKSLAKVTSALFHGTTGSGDDAATKVKALSARRLQMRVPRNAVSGPLTVRTSEDVDSPPTTPIAILPPLPSEVLAGHSHQGHDVFAKCGTPLVAARGGKVQFKESHPAGGHYIVIDGDGTGTDYAYMHLVEPSPFRVGDRVRTGQRIGSVGDSGNAQGCHLHFELWSAPGWYQGGRPIDPLRALKAWDSWS